jgi:cystathionine beta-lyase/cystathionine gamma-synthase
MSGRGFSTRAIHDGQPADPLTGAVNVPIYASSTYAQEEIGKHRGYEYSRVSNPTRAALEENLASLEGGTSAHVFSSGMAAIAALVTMLKTGDHVICGSNVYGGTPRLFDQIIAHYGILFSYVDTTDLEQVRQAIKPTTRLIHIETPTNPLMQITDIRAIADICHERRAAGQAIDLSVDNTFMSPYFQRPIEFGADIVMHSTTKFLNGHSDGLGGVLVATTPEQKESFQFVQKCTGGILSPFECFLVLRGVKTLAVRMKQHEVTGYAIANYLADHPKVPQVFYPGLPQHPQHALAQRQMSGFGALITFETGSLDNANAVLRRLRICTVGESLGGVETLVSHPATMTHAALGEDGRAKIGLTDGMVRISAGIEDTEDLLEDLEQGLRVL